MFWRKKIIKRMEDRRLSLAKSIHGYALNGQPVPLHTQGMYDEVNHWINILEGRD